MSLLNTPEVTPSRVLALYRHLLNAGGDIEPDVLGARVWPRATRKEEGDQPPFDLINIREMRELGLLVEGEDGSLRPDPHLPEDVRGEDVERAMERFPSVVANLLFHGDDRNHDLAHALAWFLAQDPLTPPGDKDDLPNAAKDQGAGDLTGLLNDTRFGTFRDWSCFLGFAWQHDGGVGTRLQVDPTQHMRVLLPTLLPEVGRDVPVGICAQRLAEASPVFEGGRYRRTIEGATGRASGAESFSASTSLALFRLEAEGSLSFAAKGDGASRSLALGKRSSRITHVSRSDQ